MGTGDWTEILSPTPDILLAVRAAFKQSPNEFDHVLADYFAHYTTTYAALNPMIFLGAIVQLREATTGSRHDNYVTHFLDNSKRESNVVSKAKKWGIGFIAEFLQEIRKILCGQKESHAKLGDRFQAPLAFLTAALSKKLGIDNPTALSMALLVMLSRARTSKKKRSAK
jgi:hypothetical protein